MASRSCRRRGITQWAVGKLLIQTVIYSGPFFELLEGLAQRDAVAAQVLELRFFSGLKNDEVAKVIGIGVATVVRHLRFGRAWLNRRL
jgi:DNA-directed RNA polymerase specialized sigma24 family protein